MESERKDGMDPRPIGVCDSGLGGLTAVRRLRQVLPEEDIVFLGDTGRLPYGGKDPETIFRYAEEALAFLLEQNVKAVVVACGTISSIALSRLGDPGIPLRGVVNAAARKAAALTNNGRVGVLGTAAAIRAGAYVRALRQLRPELHTLEQACPRFVPLIEEGRRTPEDPLLRAAAEEYLGPIRDFGADTLILGCTHYPLIAGAIRACVGESVALVDTGAEAAEEMKGLLEERGALSGKRERGSLRCWVSGSPERFAALAGVFLPGEVLSVRHTVLGNEV